MANKKVDLFAPPTEEELSDSELYAPPTDDELKENVTTQGPIETALDTASNVMLGGYAPHVETMLEGNMPGSDSYIKRRDELIRLLEQEKVDNPISGMIGTGAGIVGSIATPVASMPAKLGPLVKGAATSLYNLGNVFAQNPGDVEGEMAPLQIPERTKQVEEFAKSPIGAAATAAPMVGPVLGKFVSANGKAFEALKPTASKIAKAERADKLVEMNNETYLPFGRKEIGRFALENKLVDAGDKIKDTWNKTLDMKQAVGKEINNIYNNLQEKLSLTENAASSVEKKVSVAPYDVIFGKNEAIKKIKESLGPAPGRETALNDVETYLGQIADDFPDNPSMAQVMDIRNQIASKIRDFEKSPEKQTVSIRAYRELLKHFNESVKESLSLMDKKFANAETKKLLDLNDRYSKLSYIDDITTKALGRDEASKMSALPALLDPALIGGGAYMGISALTGDPIKAASAAALIGGGRAASNIIKNNPATAAALLSGGGPRLTAAPYRAIRGIDLTYNPNYFIPKEERK